MPSVFIQEFGNPRAATPTCISTAQATARDAEGSRTVHIFVSERLAPLSVAGYQRMVARAGKAAGFPFLVHSHMLRHSTGYKLANDGRDTRSIQA
jgi:site-specific recombinase XerD